MQTARYNKNGGNLVANVSCSPRRDGSYRVSLWEAEGSKLVKEWRGNFLNTSDDSHVLGKPTSTQDGRIVQVLAFISVPPQVGPATVSLTITQDDRVLGQASGIVRPNSPAGGVSLFIKLVKE